ncbi:hypothetical protein XENTR_v10017264 [Xenopus tropicalis]|uniref:E3 SUMO-protein ligase NSE2 n=1 Tax=Xenopus tropicalis TaxID=8364 RepID=A0A6I8RW27_XENTR|nr:E3 SUMO-protein ligase NSE2 [Xenopus tropicalis]KAE8599627.1 hypothetical protein XENTR_v10017264 [Xenopus tropicalis]KAE8599628.1 hypothetical protein XENTR_v10017264 [Xenopus tropicalis]KAE8599629.1 hypothetical protein XENTR_v10017264 [Xenopus tropicalis]
MSGRSAPMISFSSVDNSLSSLKSCQGYLSTGMDITASVALDLLETGCESTEVDALESAMLEYAEMERDLNQYIHAVEETVQKLRREQIEQVPDLLSQVQEKYATIQGKNTDEDLKKNGRFVQFKDQLREMRKQMGEKEEGEGAFENVDEDIAVMPSQQNFTCPITQMKMTNPVKNKVCGHTYEKEAIERIIQDKHQRKKRATCPIIGCDHSDMQLSDLGPDTLLKRAIDVQNKQKGHH